MKKPTAARPLPKPEAPSAEPQQDAPAPVVAVAIVADDATDREAEKRMVRCTICGSDTQAGSPDQMCWVCRRLKISAWRDIEQQMPAQE